MQGMNLADIPLPTGYTKSDDLPKLTEILKNCFHTGDHILPRPGIESISTVTGVARGGFVWQESLYEVYSTSLYRMTVATGATTLIGTIDGTAQIDTAIGFNDAVIIVRETGGKGYTLNIAETLTEIVSAQFEACNSVTHMNGRFIYIPFDGANPAFFSDVGAGGTIQATSFFDAEELPDKNKVTINFGNILYIGGTDSIESFRDTGQVPVPYTRLNNRLNFGYISGMTEYADTLAFIGRETDQDVGIFILSGNKGNAIKISNEGIDTILIDYSLAELENVVTARFKWRGYDILTYTLNDDSFAYTLGNWFLLDTRVLGDDLPWQTGFIHLLNQKYYSSNNSNFGVLDKIRTDYGDTFEKLIQMGFYDEENDRFSIKSFELGISQGFTETGTVGLALSDDGVLFASPFFRSTGASGEYSQKLVWDYPGGAWVEGYLGIRLTTASDIDFGIDKLTLKPRSDHRRNAA